MGACRCVGLTMGGLAADDRRLLMTTLWRSREVIVEVDVETGAVTRASPDDAGSWSLLAIGAGELTAAASLVAHWSLEKQRRFVVWQSGGPCWACRGLHTHARSLHPFFCSVLFQGGYAWCSCSWGSWTLKLPSEHLSVCLPACLPHGRSPHACRLGGGQQQQSCLTQHRADGRSGIGGWVPVVPGGR
jgi:hypothetical protein